MGQVAMAGCPTEHRHRFEIRGVDSEERVAGMALRCPSCVPGSPAEELAEMIATRRRTLVGLAALPASTRAELAATGALAGLYREALAEVRAVAQRLARRHGVEPPAALWPVAPRTGAPRTGALRTGPGADGSELRLALDAAADWVAGLSRGVHPDI